MPQAMASGTGSPRSTANLVITILPSAITMPQDRSMPAVRMIRVWPMAITPTTITCCRISEKFWPLKNCSVVAPKKAQAMINAMNGPSWLIGGNRCFQEVFMAGPWWVAGMRRACGGPAWEPGSPIQA